MASSDVQAELRRIAEAAARIGAAGDAQAVAAVLRAELDALAARAAPAGDEARALLVATADLAAARGGPSARPATTPPAARESLLASICHDLRNPLNTFAMSAGLLRDDMEHGDVDTSRVVALLQRMERAIQRMQGLIEDLGEAGRLEAHKLELVRRVHGAAALVRDAVAASAPAMEERRATLACGELDADARVEVDRARFEQAIAKALTYAVRVTGDGASVRISAARRGDDVVFAAEARPASGSGFSSPEEGRAGLTLQLARGLVELHGGTVRVEAGDALSIVFTLPAAP